ncbi:hypothetical protein AKO1_004836, partial [Acrasis kona]
MMYPINQDACGCNSGTRSVWMSSLGANNTHSNIDGAELYFPSTCSSNPYQAILEPIVFVYLLPASTFSANQMLMGLKSAFFEYNNKAINQRNITLRAMTYSSLKQVDQYVNY